MCIKLLNFHIDADLYCKVLLWEPDEFLGVCVRRKHMVVLLRADI